MSKKIDPRKVETFYSSVDNVWPLNNKWHDYNQFVIKRFIRKSIKKYANCNSRILNAGSGGTDYDLNLEMYHLDIVENKINKYLHHYVGTVENFPFMNDFFDIIICVGSVINYCDAAKTIKELTRVLKPNGIIIIEFESSYSYEYKNSSAYKKSASIISTRYFDKPHRMWVYSPLYISKLMLINKTTIIKKYPYHIFSSYMFHITKDENLSASFSFFDTILRFSPFVRNNSGNFIILAKKHS